MSPEPGPTPEVDDEALLAAIQADLAEHVRLLMLELRDAPDTTPPLISIDDQA